MKKKAFTTKERFAILEKTVATLYVAIEKLSRRINGIDEFLTSATKNYKENDKQFFILTKLFIFTKNKTK